jgi:hypothetical protein
MMPQIYPSPETLIPGFWNPGRLSQEAGNRMRGNQLARQWRPFLLLKRFRTDWPASKFLSPLALKGPQGREVLQKPVPKTGMGFFYGAGLIKGLIIELTRLKAPSLLARHARRS